MNRVTQREISVEANTGEVYYDYIDVPDVKKDTRLHGSAVLRADRTYSHSDRLKSLRGYDTQRCLPNDSCGG